jgi:hypothetical protein
LNNPHFILDYESLGQDVFTVPVINCSYFIFDWDRFTSDTPYTFQELISVIRQDKFCLEPQVESGYSFSKRDIDWWFSQGEEAKTQIKPSKSDISVKKFCSNLEEYLDGTRIKKWWSRSNTFDPILLHRNFRDFSSREKLDKLLPFWLARDVRTYIDTRFEFNPNIKNGFCPLDDENLWNDMFIPHNSVHDVAADILRIQKIERTING